MLRRPLVRAWLFILVPCGLMAALGGCGGEPPPMRGDDPAKSRAALSKKFAAPAGKRPGTGR